MLHKSFEGCFSISVHQFLYNIFTPVFHSRIQLVNQLSFSVELMCDCHLLVIYPSEYLQDYLVYVKLVTLVLESTI